MSHGNVSCDEVRSAKRQKTRNIVQVCETYRNYAPKFKLIGHFAGYDRPAKKSDYLADGYIRCYYGVSVCPVRIR